MPVATIDPNDYERYELESAPADPNNPDDEPGYVMLRPLPYGKKLERSDKAMRMRMKAGATATTGRSRRQQSNDGAGEITFETDNEWATFYDYAYCIGDHNLTDKNGIKLNFADPMSLKMLNPRIGSEISRYLMELNEEEGEESVEDFLKRSPSSLENAETSLDMASIEPLTQASDV